VIPTKNEEDAIQLVLQEVKQYGYNNILVIDGYSTDNTVEYAKQLGVTVIEQHGRGKGKGMQTAFEHVKTPYLLVMDGDYTYDPKYIDYFLKHAENYDEIIGARRNGKKHIPLINRFGNWVINMAFNIFIGAQSTDVCSGMYLLKTDSVKHLRLNSNNFDVEVEIAAQIVSTGRITEIPITYRERLGQKKLSSWKDGLQILGTVFKLAREYNPLIIFTAITSLFFIPASIIFLSLFLEYIVTGIWHSELAQMGIIFVFLAFQSLTIGLVSVLLKRFERRLTDKLNN
jgi:dolichol-phosphate mannosyltransferase